MTFSRRNMLQAGAGLALAAPTLAAPAILGLGEKANAQAVMADGLSAMESDPRLTLWVQLIAAGGLEASARAATPYTVFPASDAAFAKYPAITKDLLGYQNQTGTTNGASPYPDTSKIVKLVRSHVVAGKHFPSEMMGNKVTVTSVAGTPITFDGTTHPVTISWISQDNGAQMTATLVDQPIIASNAVIYVLSDIDV